MKEPKSRYPIASISTTDLEFARLALTFYATHNFTHEEIYKTGIETLLVRHSSTGNASEN